MRALLLIPVLEKRDTRGSGLTVLMALCITNAECLESLKRAEVGKGTSSYLWYV